MEAKKNANIDVNRYRFIFFNIGLIVSLLITSVAFEWEFYDKANLGGDKNLVNDTFDEIFEIPPTEQPLPPPPKLSNLNIVIIEDSKEIEDELEISFDIEMTEELMIMQPAEILELEEENEEEKSEEIFLIVEEQPMPIGGMKAFYEYVNSNIKYPSSARRLGIQGRVFVQFIIEKDGSINQIVVVRGIGDGCDKEVIRVVSNAPRWSPGKQRGIPVRVKMILPISFRLQ